MDPTNPQSWNRYTYGSNNPVDSMDPSGFYTIFIGGVKNNTDNKAFNNAAEEVHGLYVAPLNGQSVMDALVNVVAESPGPNASSEESRAL